MITKGFVLALLAAGTGLAVAVPSMGLAQSTSVPPQTNVIPLPIDSETRPVAFSRVTARLNRGQTWGQLQGGVLCLPFQTLVWGGGQVRIDTGEFDEVFKEELEKTGFRVIGGTDNLFEESDTSEAEYLVAGTVKQASAKICAIMAGFGDFDTIKGQIIFDIEWQVYSRLQRKVVAAISTRGGVNRQKSGPGGPLMLFDEAFGENVRQLINSAEFRKVFVGKKLSEGELITAPKIAPFKYKKAATYLGNSLEQSVGSVVSLSNGQSTGSGFLISTEGLILTNRHVVGDANLVRVRWSDGAETIGTVLRSDRGRDVALVKTDNRSRLPFKLSQTIPELGSTVRAIGSPFGMQFQGTVSQGVISSSRIVGGFRYLQSDVAVNPGNSGGPLLDNEGKVVGITVSGLQVSGAQVGVNFFIPISEAVSFLGLIEEDVTE
ncbi:putative serine protease HhoB [Candidatus Phycosocius bacilliformis]|uniref:Putative serine protease HhoB n=1 Tax=Candidatus Phycosocius bacilliformis TaxID=1445552 RepID=A0A2P2E878_9PROT|nr:trypsin-like peptidase domain-containing protein [Candidatus Phycosocius bacilliformis]GBF57262.1 putative serine protease HhoB [Candidatus Phycosocius bacilliformis]